MPLQPNQVFFERYQIIRRLGRPGGYGIVWLAEDARLKRLVAIKELHAQFVEHPEVRQRVRQEAEVMASFQHPHIVTIYDVLDFDGGLCIVMEHVEGGSVEQAVAKGAMPLAQAIGYALQLCDALAAAHERGIVHCDVKPANLLVDKDGRLKLCDFGTAYVPRRAHGLSLAPRGTLYYGAPEVIEGTKRGKKGISARADIYSAGATLYRMVTGRYYLRFDDQEGEQSNENMITDRKVTPRRPSWHNPRIPRRLDGIILKALAKNPRERYPSIESFRDALTDVVTGHEDATDLGPVTEAADGPRRGRRALWLAPLLAVAVVGFVLMAKWVGGEPEPTAVQTQTAAMVSAVTASPTQTETPRSPTHTPTVTATPSAAHTPTATHTPTPTHTPTATDTPSATPTMEPGAIVMVEERVMRYVSSGPFEMGLDDGPANQSPARTVWLDAYVIDETEVTIAEYGACVEAGGCTRPAAENVHFSDPDYAEHPITGVDWEQAEAFCRWRGGRLPTEAEWEKAARGPDHRLYPWGEEVLTGEQANFCDARCSFLSWLDANVNDGEAETAPVGSYPDGASPCGALDMAGNVWEWVNDWYGETYYRESPGANPPGPAGGRSRVVRGGGWDSTAEKLQTGYRFFLPPDTWHHAVGFRCASDLPENRE